MGGGAVAISEVDAPGGVRARCREQGAGRSVGLRRDCSPVLRVPEGLVRGSSVPAAFRAAAAGTRSAVARRALPGTRRACRWQGARQPRLLQSHGV